MDQVVDLNVGGVFYTTAASTLVQAQPSLLADRFSGRLDPLPKDSKGRYFIDRDGVLFRYVLDFLRDGKLSLPESFREKERLRLEAAYYRLDGLTERLREQRPGYITVGYRGTFAFGRDGLSDVNFRKIPRILICGRVALCRDVFGDSLNESRDPDHGDTDRYTARWVFVIIFLSPSILYAMYICFMNHLLSFIIFAITTVMIVIIIHALVLTYIYIYYNIVKRYPSTIAEKINFEKLLVVGI